MELNHKLIEKNVPVNVVYVSGRLDGSNFEDLIEYVKQFLADGAKYFLLDLAECDFLSSAGLFALHSIALLTHQVTPIDPEEGWHALHSMEKEEERSLKENFKIVNLQPKVEHTLDLSGTLPFFDVYQDTMEALDGFGTI